MNSSELGAPRISVIIPVLDEERRIAVRLTELQDQRGIVETIVVDGGSTDRTLEVARGFPRTSAISAPRGRALQLNAGAAAASGDVLLFLHADVALPAGAAEWVARALADHKVVAGAFRTWTVADERRSRLAPLLHLADLRSRYTRFPYGDQAVFVRREVFERAGGYPAQPLMEDLELSRRLSRLGKIRTVPACVRVSGRRFLARPVFYTVAVNVFPLLYRFGVSPARLVRLYRDVR